ncbi:carbohydrate ABC transporter permease [Truepera radiovictrix]|uniref:Binding-protein-dependent transport systems inner membrane component n=1 Tax=Truepera radiovictrix (strain DSM 17093 / CIP 108686 / LMG 22925 / RQ-24) TaxID=649638 RepID=D7CT88_TRURR|nr:sugar ABC transporter permease [Truepera radiovictrix]ADI15551.1 binding-protein-dependent transport systems inner membrane component [Truepera radiovictrix DSM 17093]WMT58820.1 sugar ABC transporter permease [Truepera radiovictrix]
MTRAEVSASQRRPRRRSKLARREALVGWLFAAPWLIGFLLFTAGPMLFSLYASFTRYNLIRAPEWVGLRNYETIFLRDPYFWQSLENTFWMVGVRTPVVILSALGIALLLNLNLPGSRFFQTVIYLPTVLSGVAAIFLWQWILSPNGLLNSGLAALGVQGPAWFVDPRWTKPGLVVMGLWWIGTNVLIYLASLRGVPRSLYEAAEIDGASSWAKVRFITLPMLSPTTFFLVITSIIGTFQIFDSAFIIAGSGGRDVALGGPGGSLMFYVLYLYNRAFGRIGAEGLQMGYASALAWILFAIILVITLLQLWLSKRWVHYEAER